MTRKFNTLCGCLTWTQNPSSLSTLLSALITWFLRFMYPWSNKTGWIGLCKKFKTQNQITKRDFKIYSLSTSNLFYVFKNWYHISYSSRCLFNFWSTTETSHSCDFHGLSNKWFAMIESVKQNLPCCHCHLQFKIKELEEYTLRIV